MADRKQIVRDSYAAFAAGDRRFFEERLSDVFLFSAPPDPKLDRDGYFERCWPGAGRGQDFEFVRLIESGDEVIVTYEADTSSGGRGRNTEVFTFDDEDKITRTEVYWAETSSSRCPSSRNRTSRRGGHRKPRAQTPIVQQPACPTCVLPRAPIPVTRP